MHGMVKLLLKGAVGVCALNSHRNYIVDHGKSWKSHGIVFLNFCGNPDFKRMKIAILVGIAAHYILNKNRNFTLFK